jgi:hypothetical protein
MTIKDDLHRLVDELDEAAAREALARLQDLRSPGVLRDAAPIAAKTETEEERAAAPGDVIHEKDLDRELRNELRKGD